MITNSTLNGLQTINASSVCGHGLLKMIITLLQALQRPASFVRKFRLSIRHESLGKEAWFELRALVFACRSFLPLPLFEFLFDFCGLSVLLIEDGFGNAVPEAPALGGKLLVFGRDDLRDGPQRIEVDKELRFL